MITLAIWQLVLLLMVAALPGYGIVLFRAWLRLQALRRTESEIALKLFAKGMTNDLADTTAKRCVEARRFYVLAAREVDEWIII